MIILTSAQEQIIEHQVTTGQYTNAEEVIDVALGEGVDGAIVMEQLLQRFYNVSEGQQQ